MWRRDRIALAGCTGLAHGVTAACGDALNGGSLPKKRAQ